MAVRRLAAEQPEQFAFTPENTVWCQRQIAKYPPGRQASAVLPLLWRAQEQHDNWLPKRAIELVAQMLSMPDIRVLEVATFYSMFNLAPVGSHFIQLCGTTPCVLRGAHAVREVLERRIGEPLQVTSDGKFSWLEVECLGACCNAPMVQINTDYYEDLSPERMNKILDDLVAGKAVKPGSQAGRISSEFAPGKTTTLNDPTLYDGSAIGAWKARFENGATLALAAAAEPAHKTMPVAAPSASPNAAPASVPVPSLGAIAMATDPNAPAKTTSVPPQSVASAGGAPASPFPSGASAVPARSTSVSPAGAPSGGSASAPTPAAKAQPTPPPSGPSGGGAAAIPAQAAASAPSSVGTPPVAASASAEVAAREEAEINAKLAGLSKNASAEEKAHAVGTRPEGLAMARTGGADDLKRIKGIGKVNEGKLNGLGIYHFDQIAAWAREEIRWVGTYLSFHGRIDREDWVAQAKVLSAGAETEFSRRVERGDVPTSADAPSRPKKG
jgi:NADH-quinone oxidoreductase subunit E